MMISRVPAFLRPATAGFWLLVVLAGGLWPGVGRAQTSDRKICALGATPAEMVRIYGPVVRHNARVRHHEILDGGESIFSGDLHGKGDLIVRTVYLKDHCVLLEYTRINAALSPADIDAALAASVASFAWELGPDSTNTSKYYHRTDGKAIAQWAVGYDGSLLVSTEEGDTGFGKDIGH